MATKKLKHQYIQGLGIIIMVLALVRCVFPGIGTSRQQEAPLASHPDTIIPNVSTVTKSDPAAREEKAEKELKAASFPYQWGVYTTAYARLQLHQGMKCVGKDKNGISNIIYCDTDSIKYVGDADIYDNLPIKAYLEDAGQAAYPDPAADITLGGMSGSSKQVIFKLNGRVEEWDTNPEFTWTSSDNSVFTVETVDPEEGVMQITGISPGTAYLTISSEELGTRVVGVTVE